jgi:hypothetical protein
MMDYCNGVEGFINYALSNPTNINEGGIRCPCKKYKNKDFYYPDGVTMRLLYKKKLWRNACVGLHMKNHMFLDHGIKDDWVHF